MAHTARPKAGCADQARGQMAAGCGHVGATRPVPTASVTSFSKDQLLGLGWRQETSGNGSGGSVWSKPKPI